MLRRVLSALALMGACAVASANAAAGVLVLTDEDVAAYQSAYAATDAGDYAAADAALASVADQSLVGHLLARRYLSQSYDPNPDEVRAWLSAYREHPNAQAVFKKARAAGILTDAPPNAVSRGVTTGGRRVVGDTPGARAEIEAIAVRFSARDFDGARALATSALDGPRNGQAAWWLGLIAFQARDYESAVRAFDDAARWPSNDAWQSSAAHYWAGRAHLAAGRPAEAWRAFAAAAAHPTTLYGQLAEAQIGRQSPLSFEVDRPDPERLLAFMERNPGARRAAALAQLGRLSDVEAELRLLHGRLRPEDDRLFLALAVALQAPAAQLRAAESGGVAVGAGQCPVTAFQPEDGFRVDRAVVFAIMRQESRFVPIAVSTSNARGLMQLLPSTAQHVDASQPFRAAPDRLHDPGLNMRLGQAYVEELAPMFAPRGDLAKVFAAYNGGPGWLQRWLATFPEAQRDPLLMMEALPREEPRTYAERVLAYMALCRKRYGQPAAEMDDLASGRAPVYRKMDRDFRVAAR